MKEIPDDFQNDLSEFEQKTFLNKLFQYSLDGSKFLKVKWFEWNNNDQLKTKF